MSVSSLPALGDGATGGGRGANGLEDDVEAVGRLDKADILDDIRVLGERLESKDPAQQCVYGVGLSRSREGF